MSPVRKGEPWGTPAAGKAEEVRGDDRALAAFADAHPGSLVRFLPSGNSDLARAVGLGPSAAAAPGTTAVGVDALRVEESELAMSTVVLGTPPDRLGRLARAVTVTVTVDEKDWFHGAATTVVVASGQHLRALDLVPRGHPGDGWAEVQVYGLRPSERRTMRRRLRTGTHVPHPRIAQTRGRRVQVRVAGGRRLAIELDGVPLDTAGEVAVAVVPEAIRLLV